jgi:hypothetical protein
MASAVYTVAEATNVPDRNVGAVKFRTRNVSADTGDYATGGFTITASQLGLKKIDVVLAGGATSGTSGATYSPVGIIYAASGSSITVVVYEAAATGLVLLQKTNAEAHEANWTLRLFAIGV